MCYGLNYCRTSQLNRAIVDLVKGFLAEENVSRDPYLRSKMDEDGYVPISLLAGSHRMQRITDRSKVILQALKQSMDLQVFNDDKVRLRGYPQAAVECDEYLTDRS